MHANVNKRLVCLDIILLKYNKVTIDYLFFNLMKLTVHTKSYAALWFWLLKITSTLCILYVANYATQL